MLTEQRAKEIYEQSSFSEADISALVGTLSTKLTRDEFLTLDLILDSTDHELVDEIRKKAAEIDPTRFNSEFVNLEASCEHKEDRSMSEFKHDILNTEDAFGHRIIFPDGTQTPYFSYSEIATGEYAGRQYYAVMDAWSGLFPVGQVFSALIAK